MRDIATTVASWCADGRRFALATVIAVTGSAPRPPGTALAVDAAGTAVGGVSGGCVEGAVYDACQRTLDGVGPQVHTFGYSDADAFAVGLTCGGSVSVFVAAVEPGDVAIAAAASDLASGNAVALARIVGGPGAGRAIAVGAGPAAGVPKSAGTGGRSVGSLGGPGLDVAVVLRARELLARDRFGRFDADGRDILVESYPPPPRLLVFGAVDFAADVVRLGRQLGYRVTVCDARGVFATPQRFPEADEVVVEWPHRYLDATAVDASTAICVLTHDAKFDVPLLERALRSKAGYIGAMGSRRTHRDRLRRLRDDGVEESALRRLRSPIGLDLGGRTSQETALSILAEITALRHGSSGGFLSETDVPIHKTPAMS